MRILCSILGLLMLVFAAVQINDPDGMIWMAYYLVAALWAFLAAFRGARIRSIGAQTALWTCLAIATAGVIFYFPQMDRFWEREVWWAEETAREGMGVMILWLVLFVALITVRLNKSSQAGPGH